MVKSLRIRVIATEGIGLGCDRRANRMKKYRYWEVVVKVNS